MSKTSVWAVSSGSYSDYGVSCVFATEELANQYADRMNVGTGFRDFFVEEFDFYDDLPPMHVVWTAEQHVWKDGPYGADPPDLCTRSSVSVGDAPKFETGTRLAGRHSPVVWARGTDRERCVKSVADRITQLRAEREGIA